MSVYEFLNLLKELNSPEESDLNSVFDRINLLSVADISKDSEAIGDLLLQLVKLIPENNDHILSKFCSLLCYFFQNCNEVRSSDQLLDFFISKLSSCGAWVLSDVLVAFSSLLSRTPSLKLEQVNTLLREDSPLLQSEDKSIQYNALRCLFALLKNHAESVSEKLNCCYLRCLSLLKESINEDSKINSKILLCSLKCLQLIFSYKIAEVEYVGEILGILKSLTFHGVPGQAAFHSFDLMPTLALPDAHESFSESDAAHSMVRRPKKNRRRAKKNRQKASGHHPQNRGEEKDEGSETENPQPCVDIKMKWSSSDSEFSDSQGSGMRTLQASVRQNAYQALQIFVKLTDRKTMFGYWSSFLPDHPSVSETLFYSVLKDPSPQVRLSALTFLAELMRGSKPYLILADVRSMRHSSFTSLSSILASMMTETHRCLHLALITEKSPTPLLQILKCYEILAENVPYNKLNSEVLFKYLKHIKGLFNHKDVQVQVASLSVFACVLNSNQTPDELESLAPADELPWIVDVCRQKIYQEEHATVRIQSLQLLSSFTGKYFKKSSSFLNAIKEILMSCLNDPSLQYHGVKLMDVVGRCANDAPNLEINLMISEIFLTVVRGPLIKCLTDEEQKPLQVASCDCLSTLGHKDFALLEPKLQILYISVLLGLASDSSANVRGSAIRCLGIFCLFPTLVEDACFHDDLSRILVKAVDDTSVQVKFKASWALGNLSDALFLKRPEEVPLQMFHSLCLASLQYARDCDRVRANAVRAIGNLLLFTPPPYLSSPQILEFIGEAVKTLLDALSANFMKVCWNACYALKSTLRNENLLKLIQTESILCALISLLSRSPNFKVRISCVQAASSLRCRAHYGGTSFPALWRQVLLSLANEDANFRDIKHQENLSQQLCHCFCHLVSLLTAEDEALLEEDTLAAKEILLTSFWKFGTDWTDEKKAIVSAALKNIEGLGESLLVTTLEDVLKQANHQPD